MEFDERGLPDVPARRLPRLFQPGCRLTRPYSHPTFKLPASFREDVGTLLNLSMLDCSISTEMSRGSSALLKQIPEVLLHLHDQRGGRGHAKFCESLYRTYDIRGL